MRNTKVGIGYVNEKKAFLSGKRVAERALKAGGVERVDLALAFCAGRLDHDEFFDGLQSVIGKESPVIGGSAIGVITDSALSYEGSPAGLALIESDTIQHRVVAVGGLDQGEQQAGQKLAQALSTDLEDEMVLVFYDSVRHPATHSTPPVLNTSRPLLAGIDEGLPHKVPIIGAGLIGDYRFGPTKQFCGSYVDTQSVVGTALSGDFRPYFRIMHGCTPLDGTYHTITNVEGAVLYELDGKPIVDVIDELFGNDRWRHEHPVNYLTIGENHGERYGEFEEGNFVNRLIIGLVPDEKGVALFEPGLEVGMEIQFMLRDSEKMLESARINAAALMKQVEADGSRPVFGLYIDCAGRTAAYSSTPCEEAAEIQQVLKKYDVPLIGFYSGVEIAPLLKKSRGLDWTGVFVVFGEEK
jgi:hypothetical protein